MPAPSVFDQTFDSGVTVASTLRCTRVIPGLVSYGQSQSGDRTLGLPSTQFRWTTELFANNVSNWTGAILRLYIGNNSISTTEGLSLGRGMTLNIYGTATDSVDFRIGGNTHTIAFGMPLVTSATNAAPIVLGFGSPPGFLAGDLIEIRGVVGNTAANGIFTVANPVGNTVELTGTMGTGAYTSGGEVQEVSPVLATHALNSVATGITIYNNFGGGNTYSITLHTNGVLRGTSPVFGASGGSITQNVFLKNGSNRVLVAMSSSEFGFR